jgi:hypothetical protein
MRLKIDSKTIESLNAGSRDVIQFEFIEDTPANYKIQVGEETPSILVSKGLNWLKVFGIVAGVIVIVVVLGLVRWATKGS